MVTVKQRFCPVAHRRSFNEGQTKPRTLMSEVHTAEKPTVCRTYVLRYSAQVRETIQRRIRTRTESAHAHKGRTAKEARHL